MRRINVQIARAGAALLVVYGMSRVFGLLREVGVAYFFGTSAAADRLAAAFVVASVTGVIVGEGALAAAVRALGRAGSDPAAREEQYAAVLQTGKRAALIATGAFAVVGPLVTLAVLGRRTAMLETVALSVALAPAVGAAVLAGCINARLALEGRILLMNGAMALYSLGALGGLAVVLAMRPDVEPEPIALGWSAGQLAALGLLLRRAPARRRHAGLPLAAFATSGLALMAAYGLIATQALTAQAVAARIEVGAVAAVGYADRLYLIPVGFVIAALGPMVLGSLADQRLRAQELVAASTAAHLRLLAIGLVPATLLFVGAAPLLLTAVFSYGAFDERSYETTSRALDGFAVGLAAESLSFLLLRILQAVDRRRDILLATAIGAVGTVLLTPLLGAALGVFGVTLGRSLVAFGTLNFQLFRLRGVFGPAWELRRTMLTSLQAGAVGIAATLVVVSHQQGIIDDVERLALGGVGAIVALAVLVLPARRTR